MNETPQKVIVTAGASGIGRAIAERFLVSGTLVHVCDISESAITEIKKANPELRGSVVDLGDYAAVERNFREVLKEFDGLTVLVNNVGISGPRGALETIDPREWERTIQVNLNSVFYCSKQVIPAMKQQRHGCIINISTGSTRTGLPYRLAYIAAKSGLNGLTHSMARELGPDNIRCNAILPGAVDNERGRSVTGAIAKERGISVQELEKEMLQFISMRSMVSEEEIAEMAVFLASDSARHVSGQLIGVCGNMEWEE